MLRASSQHPSAQTSPLAQTPAVTPRWQAADLIIAYLEQLDVEYVFGVPGGAIEPLYNALARAQRRGGVRPVVARHESGAAFMADGYYRETGKLGVCCATTGPGATNLLTGVASAYENDIPLLVITGQTALPTFGKGALQESSCTGVDTLAMYASCTVYNSLVSHVAQFEHKLVAAIRIASIERKPAHLSVPVDLMRMELDVDRARFRLADYIRRPRSIDVEAVARLDARLQNAKKPLLLIGRHGAEAIESILALSSLLEIPFVVSPDAKGLIRPWNKLYRGVYGFAGHDAAREAVAEDVDLIVAVGTRLAEWTSAGWDESLLNEKLVHVGDGARYLDLTPMASLHVQGDLKSVFEILIDLNQPERSEADEPPAVAAAECGPVPDQAVIELEPNCIASNRAACFSEKRPIKPQRLMRDLGRLMPRGTRYFADAGNSLTWAIHYLNPRNPSQQDALLRSSLHVTMDFASMGWAIGSAVGCALGNRESNVVCITGDGSFLMSGQELTVAIAEKLNVIFVVLNDSALGMVKHGQRLAGAEPIAFELPHINFAAMAEAMGAYGVVIDSPQTLQVLDFDALCRRNCPTVLDVRIDADEVPPMSVRMKILQQE